ncbi:MAG TPA: hypothetical protein VG605_19360, partial [Puia sp.]|nr:hypothetical protein [Puia sp.]
MPGYDPGKYYDLYSVLKDVVASDAPQYTQAADNGAIINMIPTHKFSLPVDSAAAAGSDAIHPGDSIRHELHLDIPDNRHYLLKNDLAMLAVISSSKWKRPICFTSPQDLASLGLDKYVRLRGMVYQLTPALNAGGADNDASYKIIMDKFAYGNADKEGVYYDEENRRHLNSIKFAHAQVAMSLAAAGRKDSARKILEHYDQNVLQSNMPYGMTSNRGNLHDYFSFDFLQACYMAGDSSLAKKVTASLKKDLDQQMRYYKSLGDPSMSDEQLAINANMLLQKGGGNLSDLQAKYFAQDILSTYRMLMQINEWDKQVKTIPGGSPNR